MLIRSIVLNARLMSVKLTLTVERSIIEKAKSYAKKTNRSLSELIENYLETITSESDEQNISPKLKKIVGSVKLPANFNEEKELREYSEKKHL